MKKHVLVKIVNDVSFYLSLVFMVLSVSLYLFDTTDVYHMKEFISNEHEVLYPDVSEYETIPVYSTMSYTLEHYRNVKSDLMFQDRAYIMTMEQADELYETLLPDDVDSYNSYVRPYIYTQVINDVMSSISEESNDYYYYEIQCKYLNKLRLHEAYLYKNFYGWLYKNMKCLSGVCIIIYALVFLVYISTAIYSLISAKKRRELV